MRGKELEGCVALGGEGGGGGVDGIYKGKLICKRIYIMLRWWVGGWRLQFINIP